MTATQLQKEMKSSPNQPAAAKKGMRPKKAIGKNDFLHNGLLEAAHFFTAGLFWIRY